jgi:hypothetical protein
LYICRDFPTAQPHKLGSIKFTQQGARQMKSKLGKLHKQLIDKAPEALRQRMTQIAINALMRAYERQDSDDSLNCYLDAETLYYGPYGAPATAKECQHG